jgi:hypothetical protein
VVFLLLQFVLFTVILVLSFSGVPVFNIWNLGQGLCLSSVLFLSSVVSLQYMIVKLVIVLFIA